MLLQYTKPDFNRIKPGTMFWSIDKADPVCRIAKIPLPAFHGFKNTGFSFDSQSMSVTGNFCNIFNQ